MADNRYELVLNLKDLEQVVDSKQKQSESDNTSKILGAWKTFALTQIATPFIQTTLNIKTAQISLSGRQQHQERWEMQKRIATAPVAVAGYTSAGIALGTSLGIGGGAGVAVVAVLKVASDMIKMIENSVSIGVSKEKEYASIRQTQTRSGWAFNKSRGGQ